MRFTTKHWQLWGMAAVLMCGVSAAWGFSVQPAVQVIENKPGETRKVVYQVNNDGEKPITLHFELKDYFSLPENTAFKVSDWLTPMAQKVTIPAKRSKSIAFRVKTPKQAIGELTGYISFIPDVPKPKEEPKGPGTGIQTNIVTLITSAIYVRIKGTEIGEADLGNVFVQNLAANPSQPALIEAGVMVKNSGNVHQRPTVRFDIEDKNGKAVAAIDIPSGWPVLARSEIEYKATTAGSLAPGDYILKTKVSFAPTVFIEKKTSFTMTSAGQGTDYKDLP